MEKRKSNWKWWVLGVFLVSWIFMSSLGYAREYPDAPCGAVMMFIIAVAIDAYRENSWKKQNEINEIQRDLDHQAREIRVVKTALGEGKESEEPRRKFKRVIERKERSLANGEYIVINGELYLRVDGGEE